MTTSSSFITPDLDQDHVPQPNDDNANDDDTFVWTQQWYPVLPVDYAKGLNLEKKPLAFEMLDQKLVLWKSQDDKYSVLLDTCPHRRAPLSTGKVVTNVNDNSDPSYSSVSSLACRYHGWEFNAQGTCTKIPMEPNSSSSSRNKINRIRVPSYPVQEAGGMIWVFMDPYYLEQNQNKELPELPAGATTPAEDLESGTIVWSFVSWPVSYLSMLENSFDPSHAPFVHEGVKSPARGITYSPHNAQPIQVFRLTTPLSAHNGFTVEHSPYLKAPASSTVTNTTSDHSSSSSSPLPPRMIRRQFVPPCTSVVTSPPDFTARLYFVPNTPSRSSTIAYFKLPPNPKMKRLSRLQNILLPKQSWRDALANWMHVAVTLSDARVQFGKQDSWTMQGQDERKLLDVRSGQGRRSWDDLIVSPSDAGVAALQKWMNKFGQGGPFPLYNLLRQSSLSQEKVDKDANTMATMVTTLDSAAGAISATTKVRTGPQFQSLSLWESHAKYCPQCQAVRRQASFLERRLSKASTVTLALSAGNNILFGLLGLFGGQQLRRHYSLAASLVLITLSMTFRSLADRCQRLQKNFFSTGDDDWRNHLMEYPYRFD